MATSSDALDGTEKYTYKYQSLVVDVGGSLCRHILMKRLSALGKSLKAFLDGNKDEILKYLNGTGGKPKVLSKDQYDRLFPSGNAATSYSGFDITLTMVLLRYFLYMTPTSIWCIPFERILPHHISVINDFVRMRYYRNELSHITNTRSWLTKLEFDEKWSEFSAVVLRLGPQFGMTNLQPKINELLNKPFDVEREHKLERGIEKLNRKADIIINNQYSSTETEIDNLKERSKRELHDVLDENTFVKTAKFEKAEAILKNNGCVVLKGAQGEGKTTIAKKLLQPHQDKCFKLNTCADWKLVGCGDNSVVYVLLDDMFGGGVFDKTESRKWRKEIKSIKAAIDNKTMYVIITSRTYILEEERVNLYFETLINDKNTVTISSNDLAQDEKHSMLAKHLTLNDRTADKVLVRDCISASKEVDAFGIGFPECARLFAKHDALFETKERFFKAPMFHLKRCLVELFEDEHSLLAFFVLWSQPTQIIVSREIELSVDETSKSIMNPIQKLQFHPDNYLRKILPALTKHAKDGVFIRYDDNTERFKFSHLVVSYAVGLVIAEKNLTAILEFCNTGFIERYVHINTANASDAHAITIHVIKSRYDQLCTRIGQLMLNEHPKESGSKTAIAEALPDTNQVNGGHKSDLYISTALLKHPVFQNIEFCNTFMNMETDILTKLLTTPIMTVGIYLKQLTCLDKKILESEIHMSAYLVYTEKCVGCLAEQCFRLLQQQQSKNVVETDLFMSMIIAAKHGDDKMIQSLHNLGAPVNSDIVFSAIEMGRSTTLNLLLEKSGKHINYYKKKSVSPLMFFVEKNKKTAVCLLLKNEHADVNCPSPSHANQTPLHKACELGLQPIVNLLIQHKEIDFEVKDKNGCYPIHIAALKDQNEIVKMLVEHDRKQADTTSDAVSLFHIAVMRQNSYIVGFLEKEGISAKCLDGKNQTPLLFAINGKKYKILEQILAVSIKDEAHLLPDREGNTPLHSIMMQFPNLTDTESTAVYKNVFIQLRQNGANIGMENGDGKTAEQIAKENNQHPLYTELCNSSNNVSLNEEVSGARQKDEVSSTTSSNAQEKKKKKKEEKKKIKK